MEFTELVLRVARFNNRWFSRTEIKIILLLIGVFLSQISIKKLLLKHRFLVVKSLKNLSKEKSMLNPKNVCDINLADNVTVDAILGVLEQQLLNQLFLY